MSNYIERYWRDATPADAIKEPPMVARFRINEKDVWSVDALQGLDRSVSFRWIGQYVKGKECQVYDAPDPGEGWRLIDKEKDVKKPGDEYLDSERGWRPAGCNIGFLKGHTYRRRITPAVTYVPFTWEDREQLRGRWVTRDNQELQLVNLDNSDGFFANGVHVVNLCLYWKFIDTGKPVGKVVVQ